MLVAGVSWAAYLGSSFSFGGSGKAAPGTTGPGTTTRTQTTSTPVTTAAAGTGVSGLTATSYDPAADGGDGSEHPADTANVLDGDTSTIWRTDTYRASPVFAGIKPGVGLILTAPSAVKATVLRLVGGLGGWTGRVYTATSSTPPATIAGWKPISAPFVARTVPMDIPLTGGASTLYLVWITKLAPVATGFAASIAEAQLQTAEPDQ